MGVKSFNQEVKLKVSRSRMFKALVTDLFDVLPKATSSVKSVEIVEGTVLRLDASLRLTSRTFELTNKIGHVRRIRFQHIKDGGYLTNRIEAVDSNNFFCKTTAIEGDEFGDKLEKIVYELKIEEAGDGGCVAKIKSEYHTKGNSQLSEEEIKGGNEKVVALYKGCEDYLLANPNACA